MGQFFQSPLGATILAFISVISLAFAIYSHFSNKARKRITYAIKNRKLISKYQSKLKKLTMKYEDEDVSTICVSKIAIWNSGNSALEQVDFAENQTLRISIEKHCKILDANILNTTSKTNEIEVKKINDYTVEITFDYIDPKHGLVLQVIHNADPDDIKVSCAIKGGKPIKRLKIAKERTGYDLGWSPEIMVIVYSLFIIGAVLLLFTAFVAILKIIIVYNYYENNEPLKSFINYFEGTPGNYDRYLLNFIFVVLTILSISLIKWIKRMSYLGIPMKLKDDFIS